jgi:hypothetical protein
MAQAFTALVLVPRPDEVHLPATGHGEDFSSPVHSQNHNIRNDLIVM